ncbi:hypothetical protein MRX96_022296 [Rhipicephalus microplus]
MLCLKLWFEYYFPSPTCRRPLFIVCLSGVRYRDPRDVELASGSSFWRHRRPNYVMRIRYDRLVARNHVNLSLQSARHWTSLDGACKNAAVPCKSYFTLFGTRWGVLPAPHRSTKNNVPPRPFQ